MSRFALVNMVLLAVTASLFGQTASFPRYPAPSPDGNRIVFSYAGDIWTVASTGGNAVRLTTHPAYEHSPRWSPDGKWIAFSADREGNDDVYIIPGNGGESRRLTFLDADDQVCCWTPDSRDVIFSSRRNDRYPNFPMIYRISIDGGTPVAVMNAAGDDASLSPDGKELLYVRDGADSPWWQKRYRGSGAGQVYECRLDDGSQIAITDTGAHRSGEDFRRAASKWPLWGRDGTVYVVTDRDGTDNVWRRGPHGDWNQATHYSGDGVRFPQISADGRVVAYEQGLDIYMVTSNGAPARLTIDAPVDPASQSERMRLSGDASRLAFTPDGKQFFVEVRGEIFASRIVGDDDQAARGRAADLSQGNPARDGDFTVSSGGDSLIYVSDREGNRSLYLVYSDDPDTKELAHALKFKTERLTDDPAEDHDPKWSPRGDEIAFICGAGDLYLYNVKEKSERRVLAGWSLAQYAWSPDGAWIAYCREDDDFNSDVWIMPSSGGASYNVSRHPDDDELPVWSADGRKIAFRSRRRDNNWDIYFACLRLADDQKTTADWAEDARSKANKESAKKDEKKGDKKDKKKESAEPVVVQIDTTDLCLRVRAVTSLPGEEGSFAISPDGDQFAFSADHDKENDLYLIKWTGADLKRLTTGGNAPRFISFDDKGENVRFLSGSGKVRSVGIKDSKAKDLPFDGTTLVDRRAERRQKFGEIWRTLNDQYYDANFHGQDWKALETKYSAMIDAAASEKDFSDLMKMMFGELNSSHMWYYPAPFGSSVAVGLLGLDFALDDEGPGFAIKYVLPKGPCDREAARLQAGDRLLSVNGVALESGVSLDSLLADQVGQRTELSVLREKETLRFIVRPMNRSDIGDLRYDDWVNQRRSLVDSLSQRKLGYLHIRGMGEESLARFETELYSVGNGKEGLVVDVRNNGGGWTTDWLLAMLQVKRHAVTYPRGGGPGYPQGRLPLYSWTKPVTVLCNEHSFSNAEIFSHAIKTLGRGSLVGVPTPGGVISTDSHSLMDGSAFRVPMRGWFAGADPKPDPAREMEGNGAVPDLMVTMQPDWRDVGEDAQLRAAVRELVSQMSAQTGK